MVATLRVGWWSFTALISRCTFGWESSAFRSRRFHPVDVTNNLSRRAAFSEKQTTRFYYTEAIQASTGPTSKSLKFSIKHGLSGIESKWSRAALVFWKAHAEKQLTVKFCSLKSLNCSHFNLLTNNQYNACKGRAREGEGGREGSLMKHI